MWLARDAAAIAAGAVGGVGVVPRRSAGLGLGAGGHQYEARCDAIHASVRGAGVGAA
jgi:hypothetical protein